MSGTGVHKALNDHFLSTIHALYLLSSGTPQAPSEAECPVCKSSLSEVQYKRALIELQKTLLHNNQQKHREEKQEYMTRIAELKALQKRQVRSVIAREQDRRKALQEKLNQQTRKDRKKHKHELQQTKSRYQAQLEQLRTFYTDQTAKLQGELRSEYDNKLSELIKKYEDLSFNTTQKLEMIHENIGELVRASSTISKEPEQRQESVIGDRTEALEEKLLEIQRLKKIQEISEMIKEIAQAQHET
jgi:DNA repair exonuclease SbcCD ATPase subunit